MARTKHQVYILHLHKSPHGIHLVVVWWWNNWLINITVAIDVFGNFRYNHKKTGKVFAQDEELRRGQLVSATESLGNLMAGHWWNIPTRGVLGVVVLLCIKHLNSLQVTDDEADKTESPVIPSVFDSGHDLGTLV